MFAIPFINRGGLMRFVGWNYVNAQAFTINEWNLNLSLIQQYKIACGDWVRLT